MMISRFAVLAALSLSAGCGEPQAPTDPLRAEAGESAEGVTLTVDGVRFSHGDTLEAELVNGGSASIGYNLCSSSRERQKASGWETIESLRMCTGALYPLAPGETVIHREPIDPEWGTGRYRIVTSVYVGEATSPRRISSGTFDVAP